MWRNWCLLQLFFTYDFSPCISEKTSKSETDSPKKAAVAKVKQTSLPPATTLKDKDGVSENDSVSGSGEEEVLNKIKEKKQQDDKSKQKEVKPQVNVSEQKAEAKSADAKKQKVALETEEDESGSGVEVETKVASKSETAKVSKEKKSNKKTSVKKNASAGKSDQPKEKKSDKKTSVKEDTVTKKSDEQKKAKQDKDSPSKAKKGNKSNNKKKSKTHHHHHKHGKKRSKSPEPHIPEGSIGQSPNSLLMGKGITLPYPLVNFPGVMFQKDTIAWPNIHNFMNGTIHSQADIANIDQQSSETGKCLTHFMSWCNNHWVSTTISPQRHSMFRLSSIAPAMSIINLQAKT